MSFRKRNTVISAPAASQIPSKTERQLSPGLRPSPLDGRLTTSTGTSSLDSLLAGHAGLPLGTSLLVEEQGTTDFAGVVMRYYAAEGLVQGHHVHLLGYGEAWKHELPGITVEKASSKESKSAPAAEDKMKIAWRYEALSNRAAHSLPVREKSGSSSAPFCHSFDLGKRLASADIKGSFRASSSANPLSMSFEPAASSASPLKTFIKDLQARLSSSPPSSVHRVVIPSLLSPTLYTGESCHPSEVFQFLHALRALLRQYSKQMTAMLSLPTSLFPRETGLTRWIELLCDGAVELVPLKAGPASTAPPSNDKSKEVEKMQGMVRVYTLPIYHEKGGGGAENNHFRENLSFSLSGSKGLVIKPYALPPMEEDDPKENPASTVKDGIEF